MPRDLARNSSAATLRESLAAVSSRLRIAEALRGIAGAAVMATVVGSAASLTGAPRVAITTLAPLSAISLASIWFVRRRSRWTAASAALAIEHSRPDARNLIVTAEELIRYPERARAWIVTRVLDESVRLLQATELRSVVPLFHASIVAVAMVSLCGSVLAVLPHRTLTRVRQAIAGSPSGETAVPGDVRVVATIVPPAYTGQPARTFDDPHRLEALQNSRLRLSVSGGNAPWRIRFGTDPIAPTPSGHRETILDLVLVRSGYLAIESGHQTSASRLIPIAVVPDRAPVIRIDEPGKDLLLPDVARSVPLAASASDDYGLEQLELRYTKVSGSGEQFEFDEGVLPLTVTRDDGRSWKGSAVFGLARLGLAPGDSLVYRVVARDARGGDAGLASSDSFFIEIAGPGQVALEGFELPPDRERYAISQQMIVLKLERLRARERSLTRDALGEELAGIAAEQRTVRANFIFLTGGEVEDEEAEAEHSHEIQEGRLENNARREIGVAIQYMTRAEQQMVAASVGGALPPARAAVEALQRAFGRNRYFLRTIPVRSRVDPSRRLAGELDGASDWRRDSSPPAVEERTRAARALLARLLEMASSRTIDRSQKSLDALTVYAEDALRIDPGAEEWQQASERLLELRERVAAGKSSAELGALLSETVASVTALLRTQAPGVLSVPPRSGLRSAWAEEHRRR